MDTPAAYEQNDQSPYAGFWVRVGAWLIDGLVLLVPNLLISFVWGSFKPPASQEQLLAIQVRVTVTQILMFWLYSAVLVSSSWQGTVGKKALGLKVVDLNGERLSFGRGFRTILFLLSVRTDPVHRIHDGGLDQTQAGPSRQNRRDLRCPNLKGPNGNIGFFPLCDLCAFARKTLYMH